MTTRLFVDGRLNYDEVVRRIAYWTGEILNKPEQANGALRLLTTIMHRDRDRLYFEGSQSTVCERCQPRELKAMRALESLTPSGSEYVNDPERCVAHVRESRETVLHILTTRTKQRNAFRDALAQINRLATVELNGTTREYYVTNRGDIAVISHNALTAK